MLDLEAIEKRLAAATAGPWTIEPSCVLGAGYKGWDIPELEEADYRDSRFGTLADVEFIVHAKNTDIADLIAEVKRLREELAHRDELIGEKDRMIFGLMGHVTGR